MTHLSKECGGRERTNVSVRALRAGMTLTQSIYDLSGVLLLAAGTEVTSRFLKLLNDRRIETVALHGHGEAGSSPIPAEQDTEPCGDTLVHEPDSPPSGATGTPGAELPLSDLAAEAEAGLEQHAAASGRMAEVAESLVRGQAVASSEAEQLVADFASRIRLDKDVLATVVALHTSQREYLFDHCVNTAALSITLGIGLGLSVNETMELGTGALLADVGMLRVPVSIRLAQRLLRPAERHELERHPAHTYDCLQRMGDLSDDAMLVGYQVHERLDRSGYPRARPGYAIHKYAKIAALADTYAALTKPRPHRPALLPHLAAKRILTHCGRGKYDPTAVRAFLDTVGLFPVRSFVELSNGVKAQVIRIRPGLHTRPAVVELSGDNTPTDRIVDLAADTELQIIRAIDPAEFAMAGRGG